MRAAVVETAVVPFDVLDDFLCVCGCLLADLCE